MLLGRKEGLSLAPCGSNNDCTEILAPEREAKRRQCTYSEIRAGCQNLFGYVICGSRERERGG